MDVGKNLRLHRKDFASEEAWGSYNDKREATPKAAFQFGVKMADGRKTRKHKDQNQKIENELKKINEHIKKKENVKSTPVPTAMEARKKMRNDY
jgi:IK cytokine